MTTSVMRRRAFLGAVAGAAAGLAGGASGVMPAAAQATASGRAPLVYVGTYTEAASNGKAEGIYVYQLDPATGGLTRVQTVPRIVNPSFLTLDRTRRYLYSVNEITKGGVTAFAIGANGTLTLLNAQATLGADSCHLSVDATNQYLMVANYSTGDFTVLPIGTDGKLGIATDRFEDVGASVNAARQEAAHAHMITPDPTGNYVLGVDLGTDRVNVFRLNTLTGKLIANAIPTRIGDIPVMGAQTKPGAGPRHLAFHPNGKFVYVIDELDSTIGTYGYDGNRGTLTPVSTVSTLPPGYTGMSTCAEIAVHPNGKFVYGSNRGHDSIAIFAVNAASGALTPVGYEPTQGKTPRNFALDPTGSFLLAANQNSDTIVSFRIDPNAGTLTATGQVAQVPTPVCMIFG